jgi:chemotaxis protein MotA
MNKRKFHLDPTFLIGLFIALMCILGGLMLEKGDLHDVTQITSALIVFGGTCGAVVVGTPKDALVKALKRVPSILRNETPEPATVLEDVLRLSALARRDGLLALDAEVSQLTDPFFQKSMRLAVDGFNAEEIRTLAEMELIISEQQTEEDARVFEAAGGYAPTIGIIGAVLGLMQVMKHLDSIQDVGRGIAVAFVATIYGVGIANLVFLPIGSKIRTQSRLASKIREMMIEGVIAIQEARNPRLIQQMLEPFVTGNSREEKAASKSRPAVAYQPRARRAESAT